MARPSPQLISGGTGVPALAVWLHSPLLYHFVLKLGPADVLL